MKKWLMYGSCLLCGLMLQIGCSGSAHKTLKIKTLIDGADTLKIQGSKIWYEHEEFALPGKHGGRDEPTMLNDFAWRPEWDGNTNVAFEGLKPVFQPRAPADIKLTKLIGRGEVTISQMPSPENNQTLAIYFDDKNQGGSDWYEVTVEWK